MKTVDNCTKMVIFQFLLIIPFIIFNPCPQNDVVKYCPVKIIDDSLYEENEKFTVKLLPYMGAAIGEKYSSAEVVILADEKDGWFFLQVNCICCIAQ